MLKMARTTKLIAMLCFLVAAADARHSVRHQKRAGGDRVVYNCVYQCGTPTTPTPVGPGNVTQTVTVTPSPITIPSTPVPTTTPSTPAAPINITTTTPAPTTTPSTPTVPINIITTTPVPTTTPSTPAPVNNTGSVTPAPTSTCVDLTVVEIFSVWQIIIQNMACGIAAKMTIIFMAILVVYTSASLLAGSVITAAIVTQLVSFAKFLLYGDGGLVVQTAFIAFISAFIGGSSISVSPQLASAVSSSTSITSSTFVSKMVEGAVSSDRSGSITVGQFTGLSKSGSCTCSGGVASSQSASSYSSMVAGGFTGILFGAGAGGSTGGSTGGSIGGGTGGSGGASFGFGKRHATEKKHEKKHSGKKHQEKKHSSNGHESNKRHPAKKHSSKKHEEKAKRHE